MTNRYDNGLGGKQEMEAWEAQEWHEIRGAYGGQHTIWFMDAEEELELLFAEGDCGWVSARKASVVDALKKLPKAQIILLVRVTMGYTKSKASEMAGMNPTNQARNYKHALRAFINAYNGWPINLSAKEGAARRLEERMEREGLSPAERAKQRASLTEQRQRIERYRKAAEIRVVYVDTDDPYYPKGHGAA